MRTGSELHSALSGCQPLPLAPEAVDLQLHQAARPEVGETARQGDSVWGGGVDDGARAQHHELREVLNHEGHREIMSEVFESWRGSPSTHERRTSFCGSATSSTASQGPSGWSSSQHLPLDHWPLATGHWRGWSETRSETSLETAYPPMPARDCSSAAGNGPRHRPRRRARPPSPSAVPSTGSVRRHWRHAGCSDA